MLDLRLSLAALEISLARYADARGAGEAEIAGQVADRAYDLVSAQIERIRAQGGMTLAVASELLCAALYLAGRVRITDPRSAAARTSSPAAQTRHPKADSPT